MWAEQKLCDDGTVRGNLLSDSDEDANCRSSFIVPILFIVSRLGLGFGRFKVFGDCFLRGIT
jgi:hypothetical protein